MKKYVKTKTYCFLVRESVDPLEPVASSFNKFTKIYSINEKEAARQYIKINHGQEGNLVHESGFLWILYGPTGGFLNIYRIQVKRYAPAWYSIRFKQIMERWPSGLWRLPAKELLILKLSQGFKSLPFLHLYKTKNPDEINKKTC